MKWNKMRDEVHRVAVEHGWWEKPLTFPEIIVMCHSELSEAVEEFRAGRPMVYYPCNAGGMCVYDEPDRRTDCGSRVYNPATPEIFCKAKSKKPEGVAVELADCILRILDYMGRVGADVEGIMKRLPGFASYPQLIYQEDKKKPLPDLVAGCHYLLSGAYMSQRSAEILGRKKSQKVKAANLRHPFRVRDFERTAREKMVGCILDILRWGKANGVDMEEIIALKHEYNKTREYRHGGKKL